MGLVVCLFFAAVSLAAGQNSGKVVEVIVPVVNSPSMNRVLNRAEGIATDIFSQIGLQVRWRLRESQPRGRRKEPIRRTILVVFSWNTSDNLHPGAMAFSQPYALGGASMTVFMDRLEVIGGSNPTTTAALLGHVLAHEMGHVLQRTEHHSASGVLKARWSQAEIMKMAWEPLRFTDYDARLILEGIRGE
jgi:hypothetical protein